MTRLSLLAATVGLVGTLAACGPEAAAPPSPADLSTTSQTDLIDRAAILAGATEAADAPQGMPLDLRAAGDGYLMAAYNGETVTEGASDLPRMYGNYLAGVAAVVAVDLTTALVVATPALSVAIAADGQITQTSFNVWEATNTVDILGEEVTTHLTVAWVGIGWVSEMRITNSEVSDQLWFNGFVSNDASVGWWDFYENGTTHAGVLEWTTDGVNGQFGYGAITGENAGDVVLYATLDGVGSVSVYDADIDELVWVSVNEDQSGSVRLVDFNGGEEACWDVEFIDASCPE